MSLKFDEALNIVAEKILEAPKPKYQTYSQDAAEISAKMDEELISINSIFKGTVSNWDETTAFCKAEMPKLQTSFLRLKMPITVEPQRVFDFNRANDDAVKLKTSVNHPAVENGYLSGEKLIQRFLFDLNRVLFRIQIPNVTCGSGKMYTLRMNVTKDSRGITMIHIGAMENVFEDVPSILYNFVPSFIFTNKSSIYIYDSNVFRQPENFGLIAGIEKITKKKYNLEILLQTLENQSLKISSLDLLLMNPMELSEVGIGSLLLKAIELCIPHLQNPGPLKNAYGKLLQFKQSDSVQLSELKEVFDLK